MFNLRTFQNFLMLRLRSPMDMREARTCVQQLLMALSKVPRGRAAVLFVDARLGALWTPDVYQLFLGLLTREQPGVQLVAWLIDRGTAGISILSGVQASAPSGRDVQRVTQDRQVAIDWLAPALTPAQLKLLHEQLSMLS